MITTNDTLLFVHLFITIHEVLDIKEHFFCKYLAIWCHLIWLISLDANVSRVSLHSESCFCFWCTERHFLLACLEDLLMQLQADDLKSHSRRLGLDFADIINKVMLVIGTMATRFFLSIQKINISLDILLHLIAVGPETYAD